MSNTFATIDRDQLVTATGGAGVVESVTNGISSAYNATRNFTNGFAAGALHGPHMRNDALMARGLDRNATGTRPGVETGMMFNQALGPIGRGISALTGMLPSGG